ncbi:16118_t:CDS:2, partial [Funneliformis mosseae]
NNVLEVLFSKESTIPLAHNSVPEGPSNSSDNSKKEADEDMFFNEANPTKVNTVTSDDNVYFTESRFVPYFVTIIASGSNDSTVFVLCKIDL